MTQIKNVLVVGAGIGGLTLATALAQRGIAAEVIEIKPQHSVYGVGIIQPANALRVLRYIGVIDQCLATGMHGDEWRWYDQDCRLIDKTRGLRIAGPEYPAYNNIRRPELQRILVEATTAADVPIRLGVTVDSLTSTPEGVEVVFSNGRHGTYDVVVGADGIRSKVRQLLFGSQYQPAFTGHSVWRFLTRRLPDVTFNCIFFGYRKKAGLIPLNQDQMYLFLVTNEPEKAHIPREIWPQELRDRFRGFGGWLSGLRDRMQHPDDIVYTPIEEVLLPPPWYKNRVILIGDAAHASGPHIGQGAAMALEDAIVFAELAINRDPIDVKFRRFMAKRYDRCKWVQDRSRIAGNAGQVTNPFFCFIRNKIILPLSFNRSWTSMEAKLAEPV